MKINRSSAFIFLNSLLFTYMTHGFNIDYNGNDPYESYETSFGKERFIKADYIRYFKHYKKYDEEKAGVHFIDVANIDVKKLPYPYSTLERVMPLDQLGMYFNSEFIKKLFEHNTIVNVIEIGSFYGQSTRHIASLLPENGKIYAIDVWNGWYGMYEQFLSNVVHTQLYNKIIPIRQRSDQSVEIIKGYQSNYDLIYIDGDHATDVVLSDLELYYPIAGNKGIVCGDDWLLSSVRIAVIHFAEKYRLTIYADCNFWLLKNEGQFQCSSLLEATDQAWTF